MGWGVFRKADPRLETPLLPGNDLPLGESGFSGAWHAWLHCGPPSPWPCPPTALHCAQVGGELAEGLGSRTGLQGRATWRAEGWLLSADLSGQVTGVWMATPQLCRVPISSAGYHLVA